MGAVSNAMAKSAVEKGATIFTDQASGKIQFMITHFDIRERTLGFLFTSFVLLYIFISILFFRQ